MPMPSISPSFATIQPTQLPSVDMFTVPTVRVESPVVNMESRRCKKPTEPPMVLKICFVLCDCCAWPFNMCERVFHRVYDPIKEAYERRQQAKRDAYWNSPLGYWDIHTPPLRTPSPVHSTGSSRAGMYNV